MTGNAHCGSRAGGFGSYAGFTCKYAVIDNNEKMTPVNGTTRRRMNQNLRRDQESGLGVLIPSRTQNVMRKPNCADRNCPADGRRYLALLSSLINEKFSLLKMLNTSASRSIDTCDIGI